MSTMNSRTAPQLMHMLSELLFPLGPLAERLPALASKHDLLTLSRADFDALAALAHANHVVLRALDVFSALMRALGDTTRAQWAEEVCGTERDRIQRALPVLHRICARFGAAGLDITVMKSLDHWPDLGSDLDLFSNASPKTVPALMQREFKATLADRSWGDRLAHKWNFVIPDLQELVEFHVRRLGQTGEQIGLAQRLPGRSRVVSHLGMEFRVPHASDRLLISTLQRMYRHFYFRLCDILDSAELVRSGQVNFDDLRSAAMAAGIWGGVASYLMIVSDYLKKYGDPGLDLPETVRAAARFDGSCVYYARKFLRVPILPQSAGLYSSQMGGLLRGGKLRSSARLGLLPCLATIAWVEQKRTGSDKGIW